MTKVLVTGGAGFIASHIVDRLLERGDDVLVIDNFATARRDTLAEHQRLRLVEETIADTERVDSLFDDFQPEIVVHAAAAYKDPADWDEDARTNALGTANVVQASERVGAARFVYFQTALCYGLHPQEQPITLSHPLDPKDSSYAVSKTAGEYYVRLSKLDWISFRLANVYGPRNLSGPLPTFFQRLSDGKSVFVMDTRRDFVYVDDLVAVAMKAVDGGGKKGIYHVSSGSDVSIKELFDATIKAMDHHLDEEVEVRPRNPDDAPSILLDPSKTERDFDWAARTPLEEGVARAVEYYREHGVAETFTHLKPVEPTNEPLDQPIARK
ncbi:MAG TPA: NAD-dependent epimerase/dehydratase family protein [Gaiellaceae bacterium]|nr:NAD-dependent epimerase/dehydratase family protein [Gaiellaceae bacterium]